MARGPGLAVLCLDGTLHLLGLHRQLCQALQHELCISD